MKTTIKIRYHRDNIQSRDMCQSFLLANEGRVRFFKENILKNNPQKQL